MVVLQRLKHDVGDLVGAVGPNVDDLVIAFARSNHTLAILLFHVVDLFLRVLDFMIFLFRNNHVVDADGNPRASRGAEAHLFEAVQRGHRAFMAAFLVAVPNQFAELRFAHLAIGETELFRPDFAKNHAADRGLDHFAFSIAKNGLGSHVGIGEQNAIVRADHAVHVSEQGLLLGAKQFEAHFGGARMGDFARIRRQIIAAQRNILRGRHDRLAARRAENIVGREHEHARFHLRFDR